MKITFTGKYKSITNFNWDNIPNFVVITGPNGTGKSQLLELIYNTIINRINTQERVQLFDIQIDQDEVTFLKGEWSLQNTGETDLSTMQQKLNNVFNNFRQNNISSRNESQRKLYAVQQRMLSKKGKQSPNQLTFEDFEELFPELFFEDESEISIKIGEIFVNYRLSEIEMLANKLSEHEIKERIGEKPWIVLRNILREAKLQFNINDPSTNGFRDRFKFTLSNSISGEPINFSDLSSGEKVLISLVFYLYNSQEKNVFPKLLLLDEPDAHLHPSMSQQFLNVIKNVLVDKFGVRVIMTTHSPSTVVLAPLDSIYEMSKEEPKIKKSPSKNHSVSLLTAGLVYVGEGTKYFLVEDKDDADFYTYVYSQSISEGNVDSNIPLVFIPASTKNNSGGKSIVQDWVEKLESSGLSGIVHGLIDSDSENVVSGGVFKIDRYSIENYLIDPIYACGVSRFGKANKWVSI